MARRGCRQGDELGDTQARRVKHLDQTSEPRRAQPHSQWRRRIENRRHAQQAIDFAERERLGQRAHALGAFQHRGGIVLALAFGVEEAIELPDRREPPRYGRGRHAAPRQLTKIAAQILGRGGGNGTVGAGEVRGEIGKIAAVSGERILAGAALRRQHVEIKRGEPLAGIARRTRRATNRSARHRSGRHGGALSGS